MEKVDFTDLVSDAKSVLPPQFWVRQNDITQTQPGCQGSFKMAASEVASFETNFFRIVGTSEAETLVSRKVECLEWPSPLSRA